MTNYRLPQWQALKKAKPFMSDILREVAIAMVLTDATMYRVSQEAYIKFEQGWKAEEFVAHLFDLFKDYVWADKYNTRMNTSLTSPRYGLIKSYWFKTFTHATFTEVWKLFYSSGHKCVPVGLIADNITGLGLAYMIMADGSLGKDNSMVLHLQGFSEAENGIISKELNEKFNLHSKVITHKVKYFVVHIPSRDAATLRALIKPHMLNMFAYKLPR